MDKDSQLYEVAYLISPAYSEEEAQNFQQSLKNSLQSLGGIIDNDGEIIKRRFFYPIKKMAEAYLASFKFLLAPEKISDLRAKLNSKEILRFLLVQTKHQPTRTYRPRIAKISDVDKRSAPAEIEVKQAGPAAQTIAKTRPTNEDAAANIAKIDKKLEEILGT